MLKQVAPLDSYCLAICFGEKSFLITPLLGDAFLTSAMTEI